MYKRIKKVTSFVLMTVLLVAFLCPTEVFAAQYGAYLSDQAVEQVLMYTEFLDDGTAIFDSEKALAEGASADTIEAGEKLEEIAYAYKMYAINQEEGIEAYVSIPIYGNYCGPGTEPNAGNPIDYLDSCCRTHDDCYASTGYFACTCDSALISNIDKQYSQMTGSTKNAATAIKGYFTAALANPTKLGGIAVPVPPNYTTVGPSCATNPQ